jgi:hypothetical protein
MPALMLARCWRREFAALLNLTRRAVLAKDDGKARICCRTDCDRDPEVSNSPTALVAACNSILERNSPRKLEFAVRLAAKASTAELATDFEACPASYASTAELATNPGSAVSAAAWPLGSAA